MININKILIYLFFINIFCQFATAVIFEKNKNVKINESKQLINNGIKFFKKNSFERSCLEFMHNPIWRKGDLYISLYDSNGVCYVHGDNEDLIWNNFSSLTDISKKPLISEMFNIGNNGGLIIYYWNNAYKVSYVKSVEKNKKKYVFEAGYFPQNTEYACTEIVNLIKNYIEKNNIKEVSDLLSFAGNPLKIGESETYIYDFNGVLKAGPNQTQVGQNLINNKDDRDVEYVQEILKIAKSKRGQGWMSYLWNGEEKKAYVSKATDSKSKTSFAVVATYYPDQNYKTVINFVEKAAQSILENGPEQSFSDFNSKTNGFARGNLTIFAFDFKGVSKANGRFPNLAEQEFYNTKNEEGRYIVREMINMLKNKRSGWISYAHENTFANAYIQKVTTGNGDNYIVGCEFYPSTKKTLTETVVNEAMQYLQNNPTWKAFKLFSLKHSWFHWGDQYIFVYDIKGTCLVNGFKTGSIWRNMLRATDQEDKLVIGNIITKALDGGGWDSYKLLNSTKQVYVQTITKNLPGGESETYIIGSGYFI